MAHPRSGQSPLEAIIAIAILAMISGASFALLDTASSASENTLKRSQALDRANELLEAVQYVRDRDGFLPTPGTYHAERDTEGWTLEDNAETEGNFTSSVVITQADATSIDATANVVWARRGGNNVTTSLTRRYSDWNIFSLFGDWTGMCQATSFNIDGQGTGIGLLDDPWIVTTTSTSSGNKPTLYLYRADDPTTPVLEKTFTPGYTLNDAAFAEGYVYTASNQSGLQLGVWDGTLLDLLDGIPLLSQLLSLVRTISVGAVVHRVTTYDTTLAAATANGVKLYSIVLPILPVLTHTIGAGLDVGDVVLTSQYAYLATNHDTKELVIYDISTSPPTLVTETDLPGTGDGSSVRVVGRDIFVGQTNGQVHWLTRSGSTFTLRQSIDIGGTVNGLERAGPWLFVASSASNSELQVWQRTGSTLTQVDSYNFPQAAADMAYRDQTLYVSVRSNDALRVFTPCE